ncbi:hypothetical protein [Archangium sp.]|uniref:hypothetical protein n=1 Tax=Archangium sp. TaxID=1872627 RepID=UPI002D64118C|nr:hypothetical protein [Archangium sp.]HYO57412.1 hypothetical protein [Archangium sp.]
MPSGKQLRQYLLVLVVLGCAPTRPPPGVERFDPKAFPESVKGPMPGFGSFDSYWDALLAACPLILSQRGANAGHRGDTSFSTRWRVSTEYCAWLYYTPDSKYELSRLVESTSPIPPDDQDERGCTLPAFVDDKRYPANSLKHLYILHNHPGTPTNISEKDITAVVNAAKIHGEYVETREGKIPVSIVAFFSRHYEPSPTTCDGFFEYSKGSAEVVKWTPDEQGQWHREKAGAVIWENEREFRFVPAR